MLNPIARFAALTMVGAAVLTAGCATKVSRVDPAEEIALSDQWNNKDSELVATEMINDMLSFPWVSAVSYTHLTLPTILLV